MTVYDTIPIAIMLMAGSGSLGFMFGEFSQERECADEQASPTPAKWWRQELILAQARRAAKALDKDEP